MSRWDRSIASTLHLKEYTLGAIGVTPMEGSAVSFKNIITHVCLGVWREILIEIFLSSVGYAEWRWYSGGRRLCIFCQV